MIEGRNEHRKKLREPTKSFGERPKWTSEGFQTKRAEAEPLMGKSAFGRKETFAPESPTSEVKDLTETSLQKLGGIKKQNQPQMKWQDYQNLRDEPDFLEKSRYVSTANGKKKRRSSQDRSYAQTGFDDTLYDYINQNPLAQRRQRTNDIKSGTTHETWKDLSHETIRIFDYIYGTQSPEAAYAYMELATENDKPGATRDRANIQAEKIYLTQARDRVWRELNNLRERFEAQGGAWKQSEEAVGEYNLEQAKLKGQEGAIDRQINELNKALKDIEQMERQALIDSGEYRSATPCDLIVGSAKRGYNNFHLGQEFYKEMTGQKNNVDQYQEMLAGEEYRFIPQGSPFRRISESMESLGQWVGGISDPRSLLTGEAAAGAAIVAGNSGPQVLVPEEAATVPTAFFSGMQVGSALPNYESEAGHAYNEMLQNGVSQETAAKVAQVVGGVSAAIDLIPVDELKSSFQILSKGKTTQSAAKKIARILIDKGVDIVGETVQGVAQEAAKVAGTQWASKWDTGEWAYDNEEVSQRLRDTAVSSAAGAFLSSTARSVVNRYLQSGASLQEIGSLISGLGPETSRAVINEGLMYDLNTESHQLARRLQQRLDGGGSISNIELGLLYQANMSMER